MLLSVLCANSTKYGCDEIGEENDLKNSFSKLKRNDKSDAKHGEDSVSFGKKRDVESESLTIDQRAEKAEKDFWLSEDQQTIQSKERNNLPEDGLNKLDIGETISIAKHIIPHLTGSERYVITQIETGINTDSHQKSNSIIIHGTEVQVHSAEDDENKMIDVLEESITNDEEEATKLQHPKPSSFEYKPVEPVLRKNNTTCEKNTFDEEAIKRVSLSKMNFTKIDTEKACEIPEGYFGFNYDNLYVLNTQYFPHYKKTFSSSKVAYTGSDNTGSDKPASIKSIGNSTFTIYSLKVAAVHVKNLKVTFEGFNSDSSVVVSKTITLVSLDEVKEVILDGFTKLKEFKISVKGGGQKHLAIDDIAIAYDS